MGLVLWTICAILFGGCIGALIVYKIEEDNFKAMTAQCESLSIEEEKLRKEREVFNEQRLFDTIDDLPEYLKDKYYISDKQTFTESDEDITEMYI